MATPDPSQRTHDEILDDLIVQCSTYEGYFNREAYSFLHTVANWARTTDDAEDQDKDHIPEIADVVGSAFDAMSHPYAIRHPEVRGVLYVALNAWQDSNNWMGQPGIKHHHALVIRDYINELLGLVAILEGGWQHARSLSLNIRETFLKPQDWPALSPSDLSTPSATK